MSASPSFQVGNKSGTLVIAMTVNSCVDGTTKDFSPDTILRLLARFKCTNVVLNLTNVNAISSGFLSLLLRLKRRLRKKEEKLILCCLSAHIKEVFETTKLNLVFTIADTEEEARFLLTPSAR